MTDDEKRQAVIFSEKLDPIVNELLAVNDPWAAYELALTLTGALVDDLTWLPHGGSVYRAWAQLTDLYATGKTPLDEAHKTLQDQAQRWLTGASEHRPEAVEDWVKSAESAAASLFQRDGDFWTPGGE